MSTDYCYECDRETEWNADEVCSGCGRTWGHDAPSTTTTMPAGTHAAALTLAHAIGVMQEVIAGVVRRGNLDQAEADRLTRALTDLDAALVAATEQVTA